MSILKKSITLSLFLFSMSTLAGTSAKTISVISNGKAVASFEVPGSGKIVVSAEQQETYADKPITNFKGNARLSLTFASGETLNVNADELEIVSDARASSKQ